MIIFCKRLVVHLGRFEAMVILDTHLLRTSSPKGTPSDRYCAGVSYWILDEFFFGDMFSFFVLVNTRLGTACCIRYC